MISGLFRDVIANDFSEFTFFYKKKETRSFDNYRTQ